MIAPKNETKKVVTADNPKPMPGRSLEELTAALLTGVDALTDGVIPADAKWYHKRTQVGLLARCNEISQKLGYGEITEITGFELQTKGTYGKIFSDEFVRAVRPVQSKPNRAFVHRMLSPLEDLMTEEEKTEMRDILAKSKELWQEIEKRAPTTESIHRFKVENDAKFREPDFRPLSYDECKAIRYDQVKAVKEEKKKNDQKSSAIFKAVGERMLERLSERQLAQIEVELKNAHGWACDFLPSLILTGFEDVAEQITTDMKLVDAGVTHPRELFFGIIAKLLEEHDAAVS